MSELSVIIVSWRRRANVERIISRLRSQTVKPTVIVWNNESDGREFDGADVQFRSSGNFRTWPRWLIASLATTDSLLVMDDDLAPTSDDFVATCLTELEKSPGCIVGTHGRMIAREPPHYRGPASDELTEDQPCHIVLGRFMLMRRALLGKVPLVIPFWSWGDRGDDIIISAYTGFSHRLAAGLRSRVEDLPTGEESLWRGGDHFDQREQLVRRLIGGG